MNNTQVKKKSHKRKYEGDENQHLHYSKSQKLVRERNRKAKLRKNPAMSIFEAGRERTKRIVKKEYPNINLNKPPSSIASLSNYTPRNKKNDDKSNKNDKDQHKSTVYKRTTFRLPIREPSAQNFDMYYYLAPNREPATVTNILELYDETKAKLLQKKKALKTGMALKPSDKLNHTNTKENQLKDKENNSNFANNKTNVLGNAKSNKMPLSSKENLPDHQKKNTKDSKGVLTASNMNASNILKPSSKGNKIVKDIKGNVVKVELDDNKENIPPLHHNQYTTSMNLQFVDYPSGNSNVGLTAVSKTNNNQDEKEKTKLTKVKKEKEEDQENLVENKQRKTKPIIVNTVSDEDLEEFFRVFDDLIPMYRSSTQLQEVIFETSQKEWNEWCYKVEQCEEETHSWLDARIMFYSRRIIEYQKDWAEYWNKKKKKEREMLELTSDLSSDGLCPNTPSSTSLLSDPIKLLGSSPLPPISLAGSAVNTYIPFQTPDESASSILTGSEATPTKTTIGATTNAALANIFMGTEDLDLNTFSLDSNPDLLTNMSLLYDTSNGTAGYPNLDYGLDSTSSFDSLDPLSNATVNNDYCSWLSSNPSSSLSMDDLMFNPAPPSDPNYSLFLNSLQPTNTTPTSVPSVTASLDFLNSLTATTAGINPVLSLFDSNYTTPAASTDNLIIPPSLVKLPTVSSTASLIDTFANLNPNTEEDSKAKGKEEQNESKETKLKEKGEEEEGKGEENTKKEDTTNTVDTANTTSTTTTTTATNALVDPTMTSLLTNSLGLDLLFNEGNESSKPTATTTTATTTATTDLTTLAPVKASEETPKMNLKTVTEALITPTKPKDPNSTINFFVDNSLLNGNKKASEFATPLYIKPPTVDTFSSIPKSYQEMYNDKMYSLISTLERCVQDKEDFWKVMEEFTSSIITAC